MRRRGRLGLTGAVALAAALLSLVAATGPAASAPAARTVTPRLRADVGQLVVAAFDGTRPSAAILRAVRTGQVGSIILFGDNTSAGITRTRKTVGELQRAARAGHRPGLLVMTDQEGGEVDRLPGPPVMPASAMSNPRVAAAQGAKTATLLRSAGVNVDLAPVADVARVDGFIESEHRAFSSHPAVVAAAACAFAQALAHGGVAYTLKHFPGLGDALQSTDDQPVSIDESRADLHADGAAYRRCGRGPRALVMVSSASYTHLTGANPAVLSPFIYHHVLPGDGVSAVTISDAFRSPALLAQKDAGRRAISAGLDMLLESNGGAAAPEAVAGLKRALSRGTLSAARVRRAASEVLALKRALGLRT